MHNNQKQRLIQEICVVLKLSEPAVNTTLHYYRIFNNLSDAESYANQVIVCACIFLTGKIFEEERKIRDIINAIYSVIKLYQMGSQHENNGYIRLSSLIKNQDPQNNQILDMIQPDYELTMYNNLKKKVLEAEQLFLRKIGFNFEEATTKNDNFKQLLTLCDKLRLPIDVMKIAINTFNDITLAKSDDNLIIWVPGIVYFSVVVFQANFQLIQEQEINSKQQIQEVEKMIQQKPEQQLALIAKKSSVKVQSQHPKLLKSINWESLFLIPQKKLQIYCEKITRYYEKISEDQLTDE